MAPGWNGMMAPYQPPGYWQGPGMHPHMGQVVHAPGPPPQSLASSSAFGKTAQSEASIPPSEPAEDDEYSCFDGVLLIFFRFELGVGHFEVM